jgi:hypothetical protein
MNEVEFLTKLATKSQSETAPALDVAARVIQRIAGGRQRELDLRLPLAGICAVALSVLAILVALPAVPKNDGMAPLSEIANHSTGPEALLKVFE